MTDSIFLFVMAFIAFIALMKGVKVVPQQQVWIIERLGKFNSKLDAGLNLIIPFIDRVAYKMTLKEQAIDVQHQTAITKDNVSLQIDGVLYVRVIDPMNAAYGVQDPYYAITQLAQTTMRSEIGKMTLDHTFEERDLLNSNIVLAINHASNAWGMQCMRYEIKDISPPASVLQAMEKQVSAERNKRAEVLRSEAERQAQINIAEGHKQQMVLNSEGNKVEQINKAQGEAEAILAVAQATAKGIELIAGAIQKPGGAEAVQLKVAQQYVDAFSKLAQESTTLLLPANSSDVSSMVAQAMTVMDGIKKKTSA